MSATSNCEGWFNVLEYLYSISHLGAIWGLEDTGRPQPCTGCVVFWKMVRLVFYSRSSEHSCSPVLALIYLGWSLLYVISGYLSFSLLQAVDAASSWRDWSCWISSASPPGRTAKAMSTYLSIIFALGGIGIKIGVNQVAGNGQVFIISAAHQKKFTWDLALWLSAISLWRRAII